MERLSGQFCGWLEREQTQVVLGILNGAGGTTRCVGGCVRDALMGLAMRDTEVDMATDLTPDAVMARLKQADIKVVPTGIKHGTVSAILYEGDAALVYEITSLRVDVVSDGRHAEVAFTQDWQGDAARRDFTMNALYADADGMLHDPTGDGLADINAKQVRFIGDAGARIEEDYLRVLRYFRFHFRMTPEAAPDADALAACAAAGAGVRGLSGERKQQEMLKILALPHADRAVQAMHKAGLLRAIMGSVAGDEAQDFAMLTAMQKRSDDPLLRLMTLLKSQSAAQEMAQNLRLSKKQAMRMMSALQRPLDLQNIAAALYFDGSQAVADRALLAQAAGQTALALQDALAKARAYERPKFPLTGAMMQKAGIATGPDMGAMSNALEQWWVSEGFPDAASVQAELARRV